MFLSIVVPTKNEEKYLPQLLESVKKQTFKDYEIILADNGSQDKTRSIAEKFGCRITGGGLPARGRNEGAKIAKGDILLFLDADVVLDDENFLKKSLDEFIERNLGFAAPFAETSSSKKMDKLFFNFWNFWTIVSRYIVQCAAGYCIFSRREAHNKIGGFDEAIKLGEDSDYVRRMGKIVKFGILKDAVVSVSPRRFHKEGHLKVALQVIGAGIYWAIFGKKGLNKFDYKFDIYDKK